MAAEQNKFKFSEELYEAFIRKSTEYFRAALMIEAGRGGDVTRQELLQNMDQISFALGELRGLYDKDSGLVRVTTNGANPQVHPEGVDAEGKALTLTTWTLVNPKTESRVIVSVRPRAAQKKEARINFRVINKKRGVEARIGVDLSDYKEQGVVTPDVVSLDLGTGNIDKEAGIFPSQRVGRVLGLVEGSEGGHNEASFSPKAATHFEAIAQAFTEYMNGRPIAAETKA